MPIRRVLLQFLPHGLAVRLRVGRGEAATPGPILQPVQLGLQVPVAPTAAATAARVCPWGNTSRMRAHCTWRWGRVWDRAQPSRVGRSAAYRVKRIRVLLSNPCLWVSKMVSILP